jgi:translation initiation factor IF-2
MLNFLLSLFLSFSLSSLVFLDTPGQIEIFTWSASGTIISESLAATYPTVVLYVVDTPRTTSPVTFMSNMLYACSIMYKAKLPFLLVFNKTDVTSHNFAREWMEDLEKFTAALKSDESYMSSLTRSMSLVLDEFYATIKTVGVSAMTGEGMPDLFKAVKELAVEYNEVYKPALEAQKAEIAAKAERRQKRQLEKLQKDLASESSSHRGEKVVLDGGKVSGKKGGAGKVAAGADERARPLGSDGIIQTRPTEQRSFVRHETEEAEELSDEDAVETFSDESDGDDPNDEEEDLEYPNDDARQADQAEFESFMARFQRPAAGGSATNSGAPGANRARASIPEEDEEEKGAEEIQARKK